MRRPSLVAVVSISVSLSAAAVVACGGSHRQGDATQAPHAQDAGAPRDAGGPDALVVEDDGVPKKIYAHRFVVNVRVRPEQDSFRNGYLRGGTILRTKNTVPINRGRPGCLGGFWELETGGYVCNVRDVVAYPANQRPPERPPAMADRDAMLPYDYGYTRRDNTPMYRRLPTDDEATQYEGWRPPGAVAEVMDGGVPGDPSTAGGGTPDPSGGTPTPPDPGSAATTGTTPPDPGTNVAPTGEEVASAEDVDAGPPTLDSLRGERDSVLLRRLVKGFWVSLDRDLHNSGRHYWRTISNGFLPYERIHETRAGSHFHGIELDGTTMDLPVAFVLSEHAPVASIDPATGRVSRAHHPPLDYHDVVRVAEPAHEANGQTYVLTTDGLALRPRDVVIVEHFQNLPTGLAPDEKWIDVNLERQTMVAYVGERPVYATLVSTGRILQEGDPELDRRTPPGDYHITSKHVATTMDGDNAADGPYSIEDVPYVMYFELAFALHSAFWHNRFGRTKSHGCVNLAPLDAKWMFAWTLPFVPPGWHGAYPDPEHPGTRLIIHGDTPHG